MKRRDQIMKASRQLADRYPTDKITFADIAELAGVHWTTVRRHFGNKDKMRAALSDMRTERHLTLTDTRTKILESAARVFATRGYEGATLDQVAEDAGLTKGAVYWHFSSKSDLFLEMTTISLRRLLADLPGQLETVFRSSDPQEALKELLYQQLKACEDAKRDQPMLFFEFIAQRRDVQVKQRLDESFSELFGSTAALIEQLQQRNLVSRKKDPYALSVTLHALVNGVVLMWIVSPGSFSLSGLAEQLARVMWEGVQPE